MSHPNLALPVHPFHSLGKHHQNDALVWVPWCESYRHLHNNELNRVPFYLFCDYGF